MRSRTRWAAPLLVVGAVVLIPSKAEAGAIVYHYGEDVVELGEIAEEHREAMAAELGGQAKVGYIHNAFGLFWLDIWTWDGRYCLYRDTEYWEIDAEQAAALLGTGKAKKPLFYTFPPGLLVLVGITAIYVPYKIVASRKEKGLQKLFDDPRYQHALKMLSDRNDQATETAGDPSQDDSAFEDSVAYLRGQGIDDEEARRNLAWLINAIVAYQEEQAAGQN